MVRTTAAQSILASVINQLAHTTRIQFAKPVRPSRLSTRELVARSSNVSASQKLVLSPKVHALLDSSEFQLPAHLAVQTMNVSVIRICAHLLNDQHARSVSHLLSLTLPLAVLSTFVLAMLRTAQLLQSVLMDTL